MVDQSLQLSLKSDWSLGESGALIKQNEDRHASPFPPSHDHWYRALLTVCVSCCGESSHYETPWHGVTEGFRLCWLLWGPSSPLASWPSPSAPTTGFIPEPIFAMQLMPQPTKPRCKPRKSKGTWRTPGCGGFAASKVNKVWYLMQWLCKFPNFFLFYFDCLWTIFSLLRHLISSECLL